MQLLAFLLVLGLIASSLTTRIRRPGGGRGKGRIPFYAINNDACDGETIACDENEMYRSITGVCNNLRNPYLGASNSILSRFFRPEYYDCQEIPKGGYEDEDGKTRSSRDQQPSEGNKWFFGCKGTKQKLPNVEQEEDLQALLTIKTHLSGKTIVLLAL